MYAVIRTGGKQYRVTVGERLKVEKLELATDAPVSFSEVLMVGDGETVTVGRPLLEGAVVDAVVLNQGRGKKIRVIKFRRRKHYYRQQGHRQWLTEVQITGIRQVHPS
jgi:large subunit ribosomal protein L21